MIPPKTVDGTRRQKVVLTTLPKTFLKIRLNNWTTVSAAAKDSHTFLHQLYSADLSVSTYAAMSVQLQNLFLRDVKIDASGSSFSFISDFFICHLNLF
jgi:hypothetical protein